MTTDRLIAMIHERLKQHRDNLRLWQNGFLAPTEPDPEERDAIMRELKAAIHELEYLLRYAGEA